MAWNLGDRVDRSEFCLLGYGRVSIPETGKDVIVHLSRNDFSIYLRDPKDAISIYSEDGRTRIDKDVISAEFPVSEMNNAVTGWDDLHAGKAHVVVAKGRTIFQDRQEWANEPLYGDGVL